MRCAGRTTRLQRCRRNTPRIFCRAHWYQPYAALFMILTLAGTIAGLYRDAIEPFVTGPDSIPPAPPAHSLVLAPAHDEYYDPWGVQLSPDGKRIAFSAKVRDGKKRHVFVRALDEERAQPILDSEGDIVPFFWSGDGRSVLFIVRGQLKSGMPGDTAKLEAEVGDATRGTANRENVVLLGSDDGIVQVLNGTTRAVTSVDATRGEFSHAFPYFLPDQRTFLFIALRRATGGRNVIAELRLGAMSRSSTTFISNITSRVEYAAGHLLYVRNGTLFARPFDLRKCTFTAPERSVTGHVWHDVGSASADFTVHGTTMLVAKGPARRPTLEVISRDRQNRRPVEWAKEVVGMTISNSGQLAVLALADPSTSASDLWIWNTVTNERHKLVAGGKNTSPVISPDEKLVYYASDRDGWPHIYVVDVGKSMPPRLVFAAEGYQAPRGITPDGKTLTFQWTRSGNGDLFGLHIDRGTVFPVLTTSAHEGESGRISPSGDRLLYVSSSPEGAYPYVSVWPSTQPGQRVSQLHGWRARWSRDGSKIYYAHDNRVVEYDFATRRVNSAVIRVETDITQLDVSASDELYVVQAAHEPWPRTYAAWTRFLR